MFGAKLLQFRLLDLRCGRGRLLGLGGARLERLQELLHLLVVFFDGAGFALGGEDAQGEAVEVFAVRVEREDLAGEFAAFVIKAATQDTI